MVVSALLALILAGACADYPESVAVRYALMGTGGFFVASLGLFIVFLVGERVLNRQGHQPIWRWLRPWSFRHVEQQLALIRKLPAGRIHAHWIQKTDDSYVMRAIAEKVGLEGLLRDLGASCVQENGEYALFVIRVGNALRGTAQGRQHYLKMVNSSTGEIHIEPVSRDCWTIDEALAWRNQRPDPPQWLT